MILKDKNKSRIHVYQAKNGSIQLLFGKRNIELNKIQVDSLVGGSVYDIEDFNREDYLKFYMI